MRLYAGTVFGFEGAVNFFAQFVQNFAGGAGYIGIFEMTRTGQFDGKFILYAARAEREKNHAIAKTNGFANVVRNENDGASGFAPDTLQFVVEQIAGLRVERSERLVHQQDIGLSGKRPRNGNTLAHSSGKLVNVAFLELR